jgi:hypothetical protein
MGAHLADGQRASREQAWLIFAELHFALRKGEEAAFAASKD